ncbi:MAG: ABC transporter substrate-binding protein [Chloroflexi bacterium]|nr:ABC transporter substrate-binding protein [Chloroflexota bacterium]
MSNGNYWMRGSGAVSRRRFVAGASTVGLGLAGAALIGCGGGDEDTSSGTSGAPASGTTASGGGGATAPANPVEAYPKADQLEKLSIEELRDAFRPSNLAQLPGQLAAKANSNPTFGGSYQISGDRPSVDWNIFSAKANALAVQIQFNSLLQFDWNGDFGPNESTTPVPNLPQSYEYVDDVTLNFKLRDEPIYFHDFPPVNGRQLTVEDVVYSVDRLSKAPTQGPTYRDMESVTAIDDKTLQLKFKQPAGYFLLSSCVPTHWIVAPEHAEDETAFALQPIGTGAFMVTAQESKIGMTNTRHPKYWRTDTMYGTGKKLPFLDEYKKTYLPDAAAYDAAWASGQIDTGNSYGPIRDAKKSIAARPDAVVQLIIPPPSYQPYIAMNLNTPPLNDQRVRRALQISVDREGIIKGIMQGVGAMGYVQDWTYFDREQNPHPWTVDELGYAYDPAEAKKLMSAAGFDNGLGRPIDVAWQATQEGVNTLVWNAMLDGWKQHLGVETNVQLPADWAAYFGKLYSSEYQDMNVATPFSAFDPDDMAYGPLNSKSTANFHTVNDATLDELTLKQQQILDVNERRNVLLEIQKRDLDEAYRIWGVTIYHFMFRNPKVFNNADHSLAWMPGWGERAGAEYLWKQA